MTVLHELLAVENSVNGNYQRSKDETTKALTRAELYTSIVTSKEFFDAETASRENTKTEKVMETTVKERLKWFAGPVVELFDVIAQKDATNATAKEDLVVDGVTIAKEVPATTLLALESKLQDVRSVIANAPTLAIGTRWTRSTTETNVWDAAENDVTFSTKRITKPVILVEPTEHHPAQVTQVHEDVPVAKIIKSTSSGMLTSAEKAELLHRTDKLLKAAKQARVRANKATVVGEKIGKSIFDYLYTGPVV